jgi:cell division protein FtsX
MRGGTAPWAVPPAPSKARRAALYLLGVGWLIFGAALWVKLGMPGWLASRRPPVILEAFIGETVIPYQAESLVSAVQAQPFCCEVRFVSADEAHAEAVKDERARTLLEAYGSNPFLRSIRVSLCPTSIEAFRDAEVWLRKQPGVTAVRVPEAMLQRLIEGEALVRSSGVAVAIMAAVAGLLVVLGGLSLIGASLEEELAGWARLGAGAGQMMARAMRICALPALAASAAAAVIMEVVGLVLRIPDTLSAWNIPPVPAWPHDADWMLLVAGSVAGILASAWVVFAVLRTRGR